MAKKTYPINITSPPNAINVYPTTTTLYTLYAQYNCPSYRCNGVAGPSGPVIVKKLRERLFVIVNCTEPNTNIKDTIRICTGQSVTLKGITNFQTQCPSNPTVDKIFKEYYWESNNTRVSNASSTIVDATVSPTVSTTYKQFVDYACPISFNVPPFIKKTLKETYVQVSTCTEPPQVKRDTISFCSGYTINLVGLSPQQYNSMLVCPPLSSGSAGTSTPTNGSIVGTPKTRWIGNDIINPENYSEFAVAKPLIFTSLFKQVVYYTCSYGPNIPTVEREMTVKETLAEINLNCFYRDEISNRDTITICRGEGAYLYGKIVEPYGNCPPSPQGCPLGPTPPAPSINWSGGNESYTVQASYPVVTVSPTSTTLYTQSASWGCRATTCNGPAGANGYKKFKEILVIVVNCENANTVVKDSIKICSGQSATLAGINRFYPQCPTGKGVPNDLLPSYYWEAPNNVIFPNSNPSVKVTPTVSTTYKYIARYSCVLGPANEGVRGPAYLPNSQVVKETYVQVGSCPTPSPVSPLFKDYTWLITKVDTTNCEGTTISEYNLGAYAYIYIQSQTKSVLYYQNGSVMCTSAANYDCLALYNIKNRTATRTYTCAKQPPPPPNTTCNTFGNIFFGSCTDQNGSVTNNYVYIKGDDGLLYDVRSAGGFNFTIQQGLRIKYSFTELNVPKCSQADKVINVTCAEEVITPSVSPLFKDYPFLNLLVDTTKCEGTKITEFLKGVHPFIYIETPTSATLYNGTGVFYCKSTPTYNCLALYGLTNSLIKRTFVCNKNNTGGDTGINNEQALSTYPWLKNILNINDCCKNSEVIEYKVGSHAYLYIKPGANCTGVTGKLYYKTGQFYCSDGVGYDCRKLYNLTGGTTIWKCSNSSNLAVNSSPQQLSVPKTAVQNTPLTILTIAPNPVTDYVNIELKNAKYRGQIHVFDIYGRTMYRQFIEKTDENTYINLDMSTYMGGIYMVEWRAANGFSIVKKVVKQ
jgi:hypothetical protein